MVRFKLNPVFEDMPEEISSYYNKLPGYNLKIVYKPEENAIQHEDKLH